MDRSPPATTSSPSAPSSAASAAAPAPASNGCFAALHGAHAPHAARDTVLGEGGLTFYNLLYWPYLLGSCIAYFWVALLLWAWGRVSGSRAALVGFTRWWGSHYLGWAPYAGLRVVDGQKLRGVGQVIYVANHLSMVDILALYAVPQPFLWVSKAENFKVPFLGWNMWLNRYVPLRRGYLPGIARMYRTCIRRLAEGESLCLFPEGTRSPDGQLQDFFAGAFRLAARTGAPIVPLVLDGTNRVLPKGQLRIRPQLVTLRVLDPIAPGDVEGDWRALRDLVRGRMRDALQDPPGKSPSSGDAIRAA